MKSRSTITVAELQSQTPKIMRQTQRRRNAGRHARRAGHGLSGLARPPHGHDRNDGLTRRWPAARLNPKPGRLGRAQGTGLEPPMKYMVRPRAWLDLEETMAYLRDQAGDELAVRFWGQTQETFVALTRQPFLG